MVIRGSNVQLGGVIFIVLQNSGIHINWLRICFSFLVPAPFPTNLSQMLGYLTFHASQSPFPAVSTATILVPATMNFQLDFYTDVQHVPHPPVVCPSNPYNGASIEI